MNIKVYYHKEELRKLMLRYRSLLSSVDCGYELAKSMFTEINDLENKMDDHIRAINLFDNQSFKLFSEGYRPIGIIN